MIMVTKRDEQVIIFLYMMRVATTQQINDAVFNNLRVCQRRLTELVKMGELSRAKNKFDKQYIYSIYTKKTINTAQLRHKLLRVDMYLALKQIANIKLALVEERYYTATPDLFVMCSSSQGGQGKTLLLAVEIETGNNVINTSKYNATKALDVPMPLVVYVSTTPKKVDNANYNYVFVAPDMSDIHKIFI